MSLSTWTAEFYPVPADQVPEAEAVAHSLRKWRGLTKENLERHGVFVFRNYENRIVAESMKKGGLEIDSASCALCKHYLSIVDSCSRCPLAKHLGSRCDRGDIDPYGKFVTTGDPLPMIRALEACEVNNG